MFHVINKVLGVAEQVEGHAQGQGQPHDPHGQVGAGAHGVGLIDLHHHGAGGPQHEQHQDHEEDEVDDLADHYRHIGSARFQFGRFRKNRLAAFDGRK